MPKDRTDTPMGNVADTTKGIARRTFAARVLAAGLVVLASTTWPSHAPAQGDDAILIIVRTSSTLRSVDLAGLREVFSSRASTLQRVSVVPIHLGRQDPTRQQFDRVVIGLDPEGVTTFWTDARIRSGVREPRIVPDATAMARAVATLPNGIGYVPASTTTSALRGTRTIGAIRNGALAPR